MGALTKKAGMKDTAALMMSALLVASFATVASAKSNTFEPVVTTPIGITLQPLGPGQGFGMTFGISGGVLPAHKTAYADARGRTLYTYDKDEPGKSRCNDACAKRNPPAYAADNAKPFGAWSVIKRSDGTQQWARNDRPLYTFIGDRSPGAVAGARFGGHGHGILKGSVTEGEPQKIALPSGFKAAHFEPASEITKPHGIGIANIPDANGQGFVDLYGRTVYAFDGDPNKDKANCAAPCANPWKPLESPQLAMPVDDFTIAVRDDGIDQWVYKGAPLYTYDDDRAPGYAKGAGIDKRFQVALITRNPLPPGIQMERTEGRGLVWADARGLTLYRREPVAYHTGGGHSLRRGVVIRAAVGRQIGIKGCDAQCEETMHPVLAAADAQPMGYWSVVSRPEGTNQWAYRGFAMYTCTCDKKPGDMNANDHYDIYVITDPRRRVNIGSPTPGAAGLFWMITEPY